MSIFSNPLGLVALAAAAMAAALILYYLIRRPPLHRATKLLLLAGLGVFPILTAATGNYAGFVATSQRSFCNGCHVMRPWVADAEDPDSTSLSAMHARNELFGDQSCYACHANYGMFGTVLTKINGLQHVAAYVTEYHDVSIDSALETIHLYRPFPNSTCTHCHSTTLTGWSDVPDHRVMRDPEQVSCASVGCHGPAHPFAAGAR